MSNECNSQKKDKKVYKYTVKTSLIDRKLNYYSCTYITGRITCFLYYFKKTSSVVKSVSFVDSTLIILKVTTAD